MATVKTDQPINRAKLHAKLSRVMGRLNRLPKDGTNKHFGYKYVTDATVADAVRKALVEEGVSFFVSIKEVTQKTVKTPDTGKEKGKTVVLFEFTFGCSESGAECTCAWAGEADDSQDKGIAKAATAALKYFFLKTFVLSTGDDPDTDAGGNGSEGAGADPDPAVRDAFYNKVLVEIPYYKHAAHIGNTLKKLDYSAFNMANEADMLDDLQKYASEKADEEADE